MGTLARDWPDPDRRDDALLRCLIDTYRSQERAEPSPAQLRVLTGYSHGLGRQEIADTFGTTVSAVQSLVAAARSTLGCKTTPHAVAECLRRGLIK